MNEVNGIWRSKIAKFIRFKKQADGLIPTPTKKQKRKNRGWLKNLSASFMIIIAIMPFAGLFLGIGSLVTSQVEQAAGGGEYLSSAGYIVGNFIKTLGSTLFDNLGIFFCISFVAVFTKNYFAAITAIFGYILFNGVQSAFLIQNTDPSGNLVSYNLWFWKDLDKNVFSQNLGVTSFNTSVFGGVMVGITIVLFFNWAIRIKLPNFLSFFEGVRLLPIIAIIPILILSSAFILIWAPVTKGLSEFGKASGSLPIGLDSFIVSFIWRLLVPFGLHHAFYTILWYTPAGAADLSQYAEWTITNAPGNNNIALQQYLENGGWEFARDGWPTGDQEIWFFALRWNLPFDLSLKQGAETYTYNMGRFLAPNYIAFLGGYPAAVLAMIMLSKKENRKRVAGILGTGLVTCYLTGVTEPLLFSFLFVSPIILFGFHAFMCGLGNMIASLVGAHVGAAFSTGLLDLVFYGIVPSSDLHTRWYWLLPFMPLFFGIYFAWFYFWIRGRNMMTLGRGEVMASNKINDEETAASFVYACGGFENISAITNCASRIRVMVKEVDKIDREMVKAMGYNGIYNRGQYQIIAGQLAERYRRIIEEIRDGKTPYKPRPELFEKKPHKTTADLKLNNKN